MIIIRAIWTLLMGLKNLLVLLLLLLLVGALAGAYFSGGAPVRIARGSALDIDLAGVLVDQAAENSPLAAVSGQALVPQTEVADLVHAIDTAATDPDIAMISLDLDRFLGGGQANLEAVGAALNRFRKAGKPVWAWATAYDDDGYYLASFADRVAMSPQGAVVLRGPGGSGLYFKTALDRLKVNVEVFRVGTYKSFVEPFTRTGASPEAHAADQQLADDLWASWRRSVEAQRPGLDVAALVASWPARVANANQSQAQLAQAAGLIDTVQTEADWRNELVRKVGPTSKSRNSPGDFQRVDALDYWQARQPSQSGPGVAVVHVAGSIVDGDAATGAAGGDTIAELIDTAIADKDVKAIVVRIDSPGGSVLASEKIRLALLQARQRKLPVVASFGPVAASGGYWVATAAQAIYASPATITGSIGVFGIIPTFENTLEKFGISTDGVRTTDLSGQPDILAGLNPETRIMIQSGVRDIYADFLRHVASARGMPVAKVEPIAEGRVWSGARARELHLVDRFGGLDAAIADAARRAGLKGTPRIIAMRPARPLLLKLLDATLGGSTSDAPADGYGTRVLAAQMKAATQLAAAMQAASGQSTMQAVCLPCSGYHVTLPPARSRSALAGWVAHLAPVQWLAALAG